jgi:hypothetical protein
MKSKTSAVTPKKLASTLRDFQESNIKPLQDSLDTTQQMLSTIVDSIKKSSPSVVELESDPFIKQLRGPMPAMYRTSESLQNLEEQFFTNIESILKDYRLQRGDDIDRLYTDDETSMDKDTIYYIHSQWCSRLSSIQTGLQSHKRLIASSPESMDVIQDSNKRTKDNDSTFTADPVENSFYRNLFEPDSSSSIIEEFPTKNIFPSPPENTFMTATELHRLMNSNHPEDKVKASRFFNSPLTLSPSTG